jgi:outer membrane protein assembly factor BamB
MITVAVVPILVQAGTSVFPTIIVGAGTFVATLLRPFELLRACLRKPWLVLFVSGTILIAIWGSLSLNNRTRVHSHPQIDWAQVAVNAIRSERMAERGRAVAVGDPTRLRPAWEFKQPGASFLSTPLVSNGRVYGASCIVDVGGTFGSVFCLDAATGRPIWTVDKIDNQDLKGIFSSPALTHDGRFLIIGEGLHFDTGCHFICLDAHTGKLHWKVDIPKNHIESSPAVFGNFVVVGAGAIERADHLPVGSPGYALSVRVSDGKVLWHHDIVDPESSPAVAADGTTYIGSGIGGCAVMAIRMNGKPLWKTPTSYPATAPISLVDQLVVAGTGRGDFVNADRHPAGAVVAMDRDSGDVEWQTELPDAVLGRIAIGDEKAFCPVRDGSVVALDLKDGGKIWSAKIGHGPVLAGPALYGDYVYAVSSDGSLAILDAKTGRALRRYTLNDETNPGRRNLCLSAPVISDGRLFVGSETGGLRCFVEGTTP